jgi:cytochrome c553
VEAQADVYGRFLATCATCHRMLGKGPQPIEAFEP